MLFTFKGICCKNSSGFVASCWNSEIEFGREAELCELRPNHAVATSKERRARNRICGKGFVAIASPSITMEPDRGVLEDKSSSVSSVL